MTRTVANRIFNYLPVLFAFFLPFGQSEHNYLSLIIIIWFLTSLFCINKQDLLEGIKNKWFLLLFVFFVLHCVSAILSDNKHESLTAVEVKLSFLAFPYFVFLFKWSAATVRKVLTAFVSGGLFALLFCIGRAAYFYFTSGVNYFFYNDFSFFIHAGYFSMYLLTGIVILNVAYPVWFAGDKMHKPIRFTFTAIFIIGIFLCASKIGLIAAALTVLVYGIYVLKSKVSNKKIAGIVLLLWILTYITYKVIPAPFERIFYSFTVVTEGNIDKTTSESTGVRILIWQQCLDLVKENYLIGTGVGDVNDALHAKYEENGLTGALEHNLNTHNQFFQTFIALGITGFLILLIITLGTLVYGVIKRNIFLVLFSIIIILNFLVESMLQTQAGNLFYVLFLSVFLRYNPLEQTEGTIDK